MEMMTMLQPCWKNLLTPLLTLKQGLSQGNLPRVAIVGIGNEFNGDDAAGVLVARKLGARECCVDAGHVLVIEAGQAPENITGDLRHFQPQMVLLIDAAQMEAAPGDIAWIPWETSSGMSASSHSLPLSMLARYLTLEFACTVHLLGIQPAHNESNSEMSPAVMAAVDEICQTLCEAFFVAPEGEGAQI
jgi:hydrogenase 3 maturation protease